MLFPLKLNFRLDNSKKDLSNKFNTWTYTKLKRQLKAILSRIDSLGSFVVQMNDQVVQIDLSRNYFNKLNSGEYIDTNYNHGQLYLILNTDPVSLICKIPIPE